MSGALPLLPRTAVPVPPQPLPASRRRSPPRSLRAPAPLCASGPARWAGLTAWPRRDWSPPRSAPRCGAADWLAAVRWAERLLARGGGRGSDRGVSPRRPRPAPPAPRGRRAVMEAPPGEARPGPGAPLGGGGGAAGLGGRWAGPAPGGLIPGLPRAPPPSAAGPLEGPGCGQRLPGQGWGRAGGGLLRLRAGGEQRAGRGAPGGARLPPKEGARLCLGAVRGRAVPQRSPQAARAPCLGLGPGSLLCPALCRLLSPPR